MRPIADLLKNKAGPSVDRLGGHYVTRFLKRRPVVYVAAAVARGMDRDGVLASNQESLRNHIEPDDMWNFDGMAS